MAGLLNRLSLGPRRMQQISNWKSTVGFWSATSFVGLVWITDWRLILDYVPWINGKFKKDE